MIVSVMGSGPAAGPARRAVPSAIPPFAARTVVPVVAVVGVVHLVAAVLQRGWWFDEATTLALGRDHLAAGYADQPALGPALAALADHVAPGSMLVLRLPAVLATAAGVLVAALVARELGGDRRAQTLTALAQATAVWTALTGHWMVPYAIEPTLWLVLGWLLVRWVRVRDDRLLLVLGAVTGLAVETRFQAGLLGAAVLVAVGVLGPRELLRRPALWAGVVIAALIALPTLWWQAQAGWPQLRMGAVAAGEAEALFGGRPGIALGLVWLAGVLGVALMLYGLWRAAVDPRLRDVRFVGASFLGLAVFFVVTSGRPYYVAGLYGVLAAIGAVSLSWRSGARRSEGRRRWRWVAWPAGVLSVAVAGAVVVAGGPAVDPTAGTTIARTTASAYEALPASDRARTAVLAQSYISASFLDTYGRTMGLPPAYSTNRAYGYLPAPPESQDRVLWVGSGFPDELRPYFPDIRPVGGDGKDAQVWLATGRVEPWSAIWPQMRHLDVL